MADLQVEKERARRIWDDLQEAERQADEQAVERLQQQFVQQAARLIGMKQEEREKR